MPRAKAAEGATKESVFLSALGVLGARLWLELDDCPQAAVRLPLRMPKSFRVAYAGKPESGVFLNAANWREAAFLFFANTPMETTIIVETSGYTEESITFAELATLHPEARDLLSSYSGQQGVIHQTLEKEHGLRSTAQADAIQDGHLRGKLYLLTFKLGLGLLVLLGWAAYSLWN